MLALRNISAGYAGFQALFDVSLEVKAGETVAVIGPNGAGKTTLLRVISRLIDSTAGEMAMEGRRLNGVASHELVSHGIAHVPVPVSSTRQRPDFRRVSPVRRAGAPYRGSLPPERMPVHALDGLPVRNRRRARRFR